MGDKKQTVSFVTTNVTKATHRVVISDFANARFVPFDTVMFYETITIAGFACNLKLYPNGINGDQNKSTTICVTVEINGRCQGQCLVRLVNQKRRGCDRTYSREHEWSPGKSYPIMDLNCTVNDVTAPQGKKEFLDEEGAACIEIDFHILTSPQVSPAMDRSNVLYKADALALATLRSDIASMSPISGHGLNTFSDAVLLCDGESFPVHRAQLSFRSPVFRGMFENKMAESQSGVVEIRDMEPLVLAEVLRYVYDATFSDFTLSDDPGWTKKLFQAAHYFDVHGMSQSLGLKLAMEIPEPDEFASRLYMAEVYDLKELKENCAY